MKEHFPRNVEENGQRGKRDSNGSLGQSEFQVSENKTEIFLG